jgi:hypothetical protein
VLIALGAVGGALKVVFREGPASEPRTPVCVVSPAVGAIVSALLARRRFLAGRAHVVWLLCPALSLVDGRRIAGECFS